MWPSTESMQFLAVYASDVEETRRVQEKRKKAQQERIRKDEIECDERGVPYKVQVRNYTGA